MPPEPKLSAFDLSDIKDIDDFSDILDADPSSDDDTFTSNKSGTKRIIKKRYKAALPIITNGHQICHATNMEKTSNFDVNGTHKTLLSKTDGDKTPLDTNENTKMDDYASANKEETISSQMDVKNVDAEAKQLFVLDGPTDHFDELERRINGPDRWNMTSSSAENSEDELGGLERDEFTFKMCQIVRRGRKHRNKKVKHNLTQPNGTLPKPPTKPVDVISESESDTENFEKFKFCTRNVPMAVLNEDDL